MIERRIHEQLQCELRPAALAGEQRDGGCKVSPGARAADGESIGIQPEARRRARRPSIWPRSSLRVRREKGAPERGGTPPRRLRTGVSFASRRQTGSATSSEPSTQPPPKK